MWSRPQNSLGTNLHSFPNCEQQLMGEVQDTILIQASIHISSNLFKIDITFGQLAQWHFSASTENYFKYYHFYFPHWFKQTKQNKTKLDTDYVRTFSSIYSSTQGQYSFIAQDFHSAEKNMRKFLEFFSFTRKMLAVTGELMRAKCEIPSQWNIGGAGISALPLQLFFLGQKLELQIQLDSSVSTCGNEIKFIPWAKNPKQQLEARGQ